MAYDTALNIISDAAAEVGLGVVTDAYGSSDPNIIQLRTLLKSAGQDLVTDRDWTHLVKEYSFTTRQLWAASTVYVSVATAWANSTAYVVSDLRSANGNLYRCTTAGTSNANGAGPSGIGPTVTDGTVTWAYQNAGSSSIVVHGSYYYTFTGGGTNPVSATSGTTGPYASSAGTETDGTVIWTWTGNAPDYPMPSDFSNMLDQTGWNRTNRLPVGGPLSAQEWQYLKGRITGVVFNVLFRPVAGVLRLYPDSATPAGYNVVFEYISNSWVSATGGTVPTTDAPTANSDIIYFNRGLMIKRLKLDWLSNKGFATDAAQRDYDITLEDVKNADGSSPKLNLRGPMSFDPLIGVQSVPITDYGS